VTRLDPVRLFGRIARDIPADLHGNLFVTGSLAAAYHFRAALEGRAVNTKDADVVVHPAGEVQSAVQMARRLLERGWQRTEQCQARAVRAPVDDLRGIRLYPPESSDYFVEFLQMPSPRQVKAMKLVPVRLADGWYCLFSFRYLRLTHYERQKSREGIEYASPAMMALANLLMHPRVGTALVESGPFRGLLRSAKDLGRVLALAYLAGRTETETWAGRWQWALQDAYPSGWRRLARQTGQGLRELLLQQTVLSQARQMTAVGLLSGKDVGEEGLRAVGQRLFADAVDPLADAAG